MKVTEHFSPICINITESEVDCVKKLFAWTLIVLSLLLFVGCGREKLPSHDDNPLSSGSGWHGDLPKGIRPMVMVNGKLYR